MAATPAASPPAPVTLICGDDDYSVKRRAKQVYASWTAELGGMDHEIVDATALNTDEALKSIGRLREALNTLPLFGGAKIVLAETPKAVTPFGGPGSFIAYLQQIGFGRRAAQTISAGASP